MKSIFIASDIHSVDGSDRLGDVLRLVTADNNSALPEVVLLGGDHVGLAGPSRDMPEEERRRKWTPEFSVEQFRDVIRQALGTSAEVYFTYGSHDKCEVKGIAAFTEGPVDCGEFYIYGISFCQMKFATEEQREEEHHGHGYDGIDSGSAASAIPRFEKWIASHPDKKPILVMSHIPLHAHRQDNLGAAMWCEALNRAAEQYDIFVFFAHNHTAEHKTPLDRQYYLVPSGSEMPVQCAAREEKIVKRLGFTYLNAGYIVMGCCTVLTIAENEVIIKRYSVNPENENFGDTGIASPYRISLTK